MTLDLRSLMVKRLTHTGSTLRPRSVAEKAGIAGALKNKVLPLLAQGRVEPVIDSTFSLEQAAAAHARIEAGEHIGKIVLTISNAILRESPRVGDNAGAMAVIRYTEGNGSRRSLAGPILDSWS